MLEAEHDLRDEVTVGRAGIRGFSPAALRRHRSLKHYSLSEVSTLSGVSATTINAWETGRSRPSPRTLGAVADALGVQVADLAPIKEADVHMPDLRFQAGLNQQDLADAAGLTIGILSTIELGHRQPDDKQVTALAAALGLDPAFLVAVWIRTRNARIARLKSR
jgi:transcriptional regulator with XRE-family HTH domain